MHQILIKIRSKSFSILERRSCEPHTRCDLIQNPLQYLNIHFSGENPRVNAQSSIDRPEFREKCRWNHDIWVLLVRKHSPGVILRLLFLDLKLSRGKVLPGSGIVNDIPSCADPRQSLRVYLGRMNLSEKKEKGYQPKPPIQIRKFHGVRLQPIKPIKPFQPISTERKIAKKEEKQKRRSILDFPDPKLPDL